MRRTLVAVAVLVLLSGAAVIAAAPPTTRSANPAAMLALMQDKSQPAPAVETFQGTIKKMGDKFVLSDESTKASYQLDDQQTASKFSGKKVKVVGTLDAANNTIRVQSIESVSA